MTADVSSSHSGAPAARHSGMARIGLAVLGVATVLVGALLLVNPFAAVRTLGLLLGLALVIGGCLGIASGWEAGRRGVGGPLRAGVVVGGLVPPLLAGVPPW